MTFFHQKYRHTDSERPHMERSSVATTLSPVVIATASLTHLVSQCLNTQRKRGGG
jgi:hypothetical protein